MFTGIIEELAEVKSVKEFEDFYTVEILSGFSDKIKVGDSIAINGVCLTATDVDNTCFTVDIIKESLDRSSLRDLNKRTYVNLERSMKASSRIDGHIIQGHVESTSTIVGRESFNNQTNFTIEVDRNYLKYCIKKGAIALDGISLTVADIVDDNIVVAIIPHTLDNTTLKFKQCYDIIKTAEETTISGFGKGGLLLFFETGIDVVFTGLLIFISFFNQ